MFIDDELLAMASTCELSAASLRYTKLLLSPVVMVSLKVMTSSLPAEAVWLLWVGLSVVMVGSTVS